MFELIKITFIGLLSACTIVSFAESLTINSKGHINCGNL